MRMFRLSVVLISIVTHALVSRIFAEEGARIESEIGDVTAAREDAERIFTERRFRPFLTCRSDPAGNPQRLQEDACSC